MSAARPATALLPDGRLVQGLHVIDGGIERFAFHTFYRNQEIAQVLTPSEWVSIEDKDQRS